jgi:hypothetical protein
MQKTNDENKARGMRMAKIPKNGTAYQGMSFGQNAIAPSRYGIILILIRIAIKLRTFPYTQLRKINVAGFNQNSSSCILRSHELSTGNTLCVDVN